MRAKNWEHTPHTKQLKKKLIKALVILVLAGVMIASNNSYLVFGALFGLWLVLFNSLKSDETGSGSTTNDEYDDDYYDEYDGIRGFDGLVGDASIDIAERSRWGLDPK